ncbi:hypothetical protein GCM10008018_63900 [Paenibacillus marchantiophytorum]|uniref:Uncharacterized protein n=1 Tax=Paenibacillus marchantiophytorum TaxID=1619310 RepID=A0ABQ1FFH7_9BACL|nr:hypothetical protein GCM10008018_63900 [Paenibacillus marchantiophytorum]
MELLLGKAKAMPPITSLGLPPVMSGAKRRQLGSRPESDGASKIVAMGRPTVCVHWKATLDLAKEKKKWLAESSFPGVIEPGMLHNGYTGTWETQRLFHEGVLVRKTHESMANN